MTARMRRIESDWEQIKKDFAGHPNIIVTPIGGEPPEKYHVVYFVNGIYLLPDGRIETLARHEVDIILHAEYPRYKPICRIYTPIWHPNFRDGQICIGDIWGAGESLSDIIINIGDMIQYKSWNSYSPLSSEAAQWAMLNKHLFPVGNVNLNIADYSAARDEVEIDLLDDDNNQDGDGLQTAESLSAAAQPVISPTLQSFDPPSVQASVGWDTFAPPPLLVKEESQNDFDITAEDLAGVEFIPSAQRMQAVRNDAVVKGKKVNFKTVLVKGLLWALIGAAMGFGVSELGNNTFVNGANAAVLAGYPELVDYYVYEAREEQTEILLLEHYQTFCRENQIDPDGSTSYQRWLDAMTSEEKRLLNDYDNYSTFMYGTLQDVQTSNNWTDQELERTILSVERLRVALWSAILALFIGLFLGIGEGVYYGAKGKVFKYALIGAGVSILIGFISGYIAQWIYSAAQIAIVTDVGAAFVRGVGWAIMGLGIGIATGFIKPTKKRILFCALGGLAGAFIGGFLFDYVYEIIPNDMAARCIAEIIMGALIGIGVGMLEQFAKQAWLKVIRGEFEGKEYLLFAGTTSIGNNGKNTIVLFKDKLVAPHHCDIVLEGSKYVVNDQGSALGTIVNGVRVNRHVLRQGDAIALGNSVLIFNTR